MEAELIGRGVHVVAMPYPTQGHISPMLRLSHLLAARGITITFVHLQSNFSRLHLSHQETSGAEEYTSRIHHISLSGSLPANPSFSAMSTRDRVLASEDLQPCFTHLLARLHAASKVSCVIADVLMSWALSVAEKMGILGASLSTASLSSFACDCNIPLLAGLGVFPIQDMEGGAQQALIRCIPGLPQIFSYADLPSFFHTPSWPDVVLDFILRQMKLMRKATWVLSNSASLEPEIELEETMKKSMQIICIGPLLSIHKISVNENDQSTEANHVDEISSDGHRCSNCKSTSGHMGSHPTASLWCEDMSCLEWLCGRPASSVLYISFGSLVVLSQDQIEEIFLGLEASQCPFLWALHPEAIEIDQADGGHSPALDVVARFSKQGLVVSWSPQMDVLAHSAVGGFMTHCGWNSVMESVAVGKPMLGFPLYAEQRMNCKLLEYWQVGKELRVGTKGLVERREVESCVRSVMDGNESRSFRGACAKLSDRLRHATTNKNGTSLKSLERFVKELCERTF